MFGVALMSVVSASARRASTDLAYFSEYCFGLKNKGFHESWYNTIQNYDIRSGLIIAPRNSAKSTCWAKIAPLWLLGNNPDLRIVIVSRTSTLAQTNMRFIRMNIESNDKVKEVFPYQVIDDKIHGLKPNTPWGEEQITVKNNRMDGAPSIYAVGLEGSITGIRADLIVVDDLVDQNNVMTDSQREKVNAFWDTVVMPTLNPTGRIFAVGTRYYAKDFYTRLLEDPMYKDNAFIFPAIELNGKGEYKLGEDGKPISYWPERWPIEALMEMKERMGSLAFNSQMMCDISGYAGQLFDPEWLQYYDPLHDLMPVWGNLDFVMSVDPNITDDPESDNTAIPTAAVDRKNTTIYVLDIFAKPIGFLEQVKEIQHYGRRLQISVGSHRFEPEIHISKIGIESTAYQRSLQQTGYIMGLPVVEIKQHNIKKDVRILGLGPHFESGRLRFPNPSVMKVPWWDGFYEEYCTFPKGRRDDRLDALEILVNMVSESFGQTGIPWGPGSDVRNRNFNTFGSVFPVR